MLEHINTTTHDNRREAERTAPLFKMPKNIRQIGAGDQKRKIYIEDYVMTYIKQLSLKAITDYSYMVLLGQFIMIDGEWNIFISGAVEIENYSVEETSSFTNEIWTSIYENIKEYFNDVEIVGWGIIRTGLQLVPTENIRYSHVDNFAGEGKVLFMYDPLEREEIFYIYEKNGLKSQDGYYIYYEKNEDMQNYLIAQKEGNVSEEAEYEDKTTKEIRKVIAEKKERQRVKFNGHRGVMYAAGTLTAAVVLVLGSAVLVNNSRMRGMEEALDVISHNLSEQVSGGKEKKEEDKDQTGKTTKVETIGGNITTIRGETFAEEQNQNNMGNGKENLPDNSENNNTKDADQDETGEKTDDKGSNKELDENEKTSKENSDNKLEDEKETGNNPANYYIVEAGDSLASISMKVYNTTDRIKDIQEINNLEDENKILAGQKLIMPK